MVLTRTVPPTVGDGDRDTGSAAPLAAAEVAPETAVRGRAVDTEERRETAPDSGVADSRPLATLAPAAVLLLRRLWVVWAVIGRVPVSAADAGEGSTNDGDTSTWASGAGADAVSCERLVTPTETRERRDATLPAVEARRATGNAGTTGAAAAAAVGVLVMRFTVRSQDTPSKELVRTRTRRHSETAPGRHNSRAEEDESNTDCHGGCNDEPCPNPLL